MSIMAVAVMVMAMNVIVLFLFVVFILGIVEGCGQRTTTLHTYLQQSVPLLPHALVRLDARRRILLQDSFGRH